MKKLFLFIILIPFLVSSVTAVFNTSGIKFAVNLTNSATGGISVPIDGTVNGTVAGSPTINATGMLIPKDVNKYLSYGSMPLGAAGSNYSWGCEIQNVGAGTTINAYFTRAKAATTVANPLEFRWYDTGFQFNFGNGAAQGTLDYTVNIGTGVRRKVAIIKANTNYTILINGTPMASTVNAQALVDDTSLNLYIGKASYATWTANDWFRNCWMFNRSLSYAEVADIANNMTNVSFFLPSAAPPPSVASQLVATNIVTGSTQTARNFVIMANSTYTNTNGNSTCVLSLNNTVNTTYGYINPTINFNYTLSTDGWDSVGRPTSFNISCNNTNSSSNIQILFGYTFLYTVNGTVIDSSGNTLQGISVIATNKTTNQTINSTQTDSLGQYSFNLVNQYGNNISVQAFNLSVADTKGPSINLTMVSSRDSGTSQGMLNIKLTSNFTVKTQNNVQIVIGVLATNVTPPSACSTNAWDCSQNCNIASFNAGGNTIVITGTGVITITGDVTNCATTTTRVIRTGNCVLKRVGNIKFC